MSAIDFRAGEVAGRLDLNLSYGALYRTEDYNPGIVAVANGGRALSANSDDGTLNYGKGLASSMFATSAELTLRRGPYSAFSRAIAFYDIEQEQHDRRHRPFESADLNQLGSDIELRDTYLGAEFSPGGMPLMLRAGDQVINWGETTFVRDGVDTINPLDLLSTFQPARSPRDLRTPQGMLWGAANLTETFAVEAYYQYDWEPVVYPPPGYLFSTSDLTGEGRRKFVQLGNGQVSDLGTDLDAAFGLPDGTLGRDERFLQLPQHADRKPRDGGQYGVALVQITQGTNALKWGLHYLRYHSRLPLLGATTADQAAVDQTDPDDVAQVAGELAPVYQAQGLDPPAAQAAATTAASQLVLSRYANQAGYFIEYPEDISMIAATFNTATMRTGTLVAGEISWHHDVPLQLALGDVFNAALSPVRFDPAFASGPLGAYGATADIQGYERLDRTQLALSAAQFLPAVLGATQLLVAMDGAFIRIHDYPDANEPQLQAPGGGDADSWGYRALAQLQYSNVFGAVNVAPRIAFAHDVRGYTPAPFAAFWEGRKAVVMGVGADYINHLTVDLAWTMFLGGGSANPLRDRDFVRFNVTWWF